MTIRITDGYLSSILIGDLNRNLGSMFKQQRMAGSMQRVNEYADDPRALAAIQRYRALISQNDEYVGNASRARALLNATDTALQDVSDVLADVRVIALRESSAVATAQTMGMAAVEVEHLVDRLLDVLNSSVEGNYIFAGTRTDRAPFQQQGSIVSYVGNEEEIETRTGPNSLLPVNLTGDVLLGTRSSSLSSTVDLAPGLQGTTALSELNMGNGWEPGAIYIENGNGTRWQIDLTSALTVDDVINAINTGTGGEVTAGLGPDGEALVLTGVGPFTVSETGEGGTAASLGLTGSSLGNTLTGRDIRPAATENTALVDIPSLSGGLPLGTIELAWQGQTYFIGLSGASTLGEIQSTIDAIVPGLEVVVNPSGLTFIGASPESFFIDDADSTMTATKLGIRGTGTPTRLFGVLEDLATALRAGDKLAMIATLNELESLEGLVQEQLLLVGGKQTDLDWAETMLLHRDEQLRSNLSLEQDIDVAQVATDLSRTQSAYQASLLVTSKLFQLNLMHYL